MRVSEQGSGWREDVSSLLRQIQNEGDLAKRMKKIADRLVGRPYLSDPLIGGPDVPERVVIDLGGFDCVTFVETVLALGRSRSRMGFAAELLSTRYLQGEVSYRKRLHYFSDWMRANQRRGAIRIRSAGAGAKTISCALSLLPAFPARTVRFAVVPKRDLALARARIGEGAIVAFASVRAGLDFFHTGLLFAGAPARRAGDSLWLYHASRSQGKVVAQPLSDFLGQQRMRGLAFATPLDTGERT